MHRVGWTGLMVLILVTLAAGGLRLPPAAASTPLEEWMVFSHRPQVFAIADDGDFLWTGGYGLARLNKATGELSFWNALNSGLPDDTVSGLAIDAQGNVWMMAGACLVRFDRENWMLRDLKQYYWRREKWGRNVDLAIDGQGRKWVVAGVYLGCLDREDWIVYHSANSGVPSFGVDDVAFDAEGSLWIASRGAGLLKYDDEMWTQYNTGNCAIPSDEVHALAIDAQGSKWTLAGTSLIEFDDLSWTVRDAPDSALEYASLDLLTIDREGHKWSVLTSDRLKVLAEFDGAGWTLHPLPEMMTSWRSDYQCLSTDAEGNVWMGGGDAAWIGGGGGLAKYDRENWTLYDMNSTGPPDDQITALAVDVAGTRWVGTGNGLAEFDGENWTFHNAHQSGLPSSRIQALATDAAGNTWVGTPNGLARFDGQNWAVYDTGNSELPSDNVTAIAVDPQGRIWIGTQPQGDVELGPGGLAELDGERWTVYDTTNSSLPSNIVTAVATDRRGNVWIGTEPHRKWTAEQWEPGEMELVGGGLARFDREHWTVYDASGSPLPSNTVTAIAVDPQGPVWVGTEPGWGGEGCSGGLARLQGDEWTVYDTSNSKMPANEVHALAIDAQGNPWFGSLGLVDGENWQVYNQSNSKMPSNAVTAIAIDPQGNKWVGTTNGLAVYREGAIALTEAEVVRVEEKPDAAVPSGFSLSQNVPNPFNSAATIRFTLPQDAARVTLAVYNLRGQQVRTLADGPMSAGTHAIRWNGRDDLEQDAASGVYFCRLTTYDGGQTQTTKMVLMR